MWVVDKESSTYESLLGEFSNLEWFEDAEKFLQSMDGRGGEHGVVVAEMELPGLGGIELVEKLRQRGLAMPVVLVCAAADVATAVEAIRRGAADFFEKPVPYHLLVGSIRHLAERSHEPPQKAGT